MPRRMIALGLWLWIAAVLGAYLWPFRAFLAPRAALLHRGASP